MTEIEINWRTLWQDGNCTCNTAWYKNVQQTEKKQEIFLSNSLPKFRQTKWS